MRNTLILRTTFILSSFGLPLLVCNPPRVSAAPAVATPLEARDGDWTFQVSSSGFMPGDASLNRKRATHEAPAFVAYFKSSHATKTDPVDWTLNLRARVFSPADVPLPTKLNGGTVVSEAVDPKWPFVWVEFSGRDPFAPDGLSPRVANGEILQNFVLEMPKAPVGQEVTLDKVFTSDIGSTLKVEKVTLVEQNGRAVLKSKVSWTRPADAPEAMLQGRAPDFLNEEGYPSQQGGGGGMGQDGGEFDTVLTELPTTDTWKLRFSLQQNVASRAVAAGRFKVRIKVPLSADTIVLPNDAATQSPASVTADGLAGRVENSGFFQGPVWMGKLWVRDTKDTSIFWKPKTLTFSLPEGQEFKANSSGQPSSPTFHRDGSQASKGEWAQGVMAMMPATPTRPQTLKLDAELEARRLVDADFAVTSPIPKPGETLALDTDVRSQLGIGLTLVAARFYTDVSQVPGTRFTDQIPKRGLALVFKGTPVSPNPAVYYCLSNNERGFARDSQGRPLDGALGFGVKWQDCNALVKNSAAQQYFSAFVPAPAPDAKEIELAGYLHEESEPLKTVKVRIEKVPVVPAPQPQKPQ